MGWSLNNFADPVGWFTGGFANSEDVTGSSALTDYIPGIGDAKAQDKANKINQQEAQINRDFQERMSSTAYQRAMDDMRKAGLNPMLAYAQGGASAPTGAQATVDAVSKTGLAKAGLEAYTGISSANTARMQANTAQSQAESSIALQGAQAANTVASTAKTQAETQKTIDSIKNQKVRRELEAAQIPLAKIKEGASNMANESLKRLDQTFLKNSAKPRMDRRTLEYKKPWFEKIWNPGPTSRLPKGTKTNKMINKF